MKVINNEKYITMLEVNVGDVFIYHGDAYIKTNIDFNRLIGVVKLANGEVSGLATTTKVKSIPNCELRIQTDYNYTSLENAADRIQDVLDVFTETGIDEDIDITEQDYDPCTVLTRIFKIVRNRG